MTESECHIGSRRGRAEFIYAILSSATAEEGVIKTNIVGNNKILWRTIGPYLDYCLEHNLLIKEGRRYRLTKKGMEALEALERAFRAIE